MRNFFFGALLLLGLQANAQAPAATPCASPGLHLLAGAQEIKATGSPFVPKFTVKLVPDPACAEKYTYRPGIVLVTLARDRKPVVPTQGTYGPEVDLSAWAKLYQPGDRLYIEIDHLEITGPDGKKLPVDNKARKPSLNWILTK